MNDTNKPTWYSWDRVNHILARATELEAEQDLMVSEDELLRIAGEVGIDIAALRQAIDEARSDVGRARKLDTGLQPERGLKVLPWLFPTLATGAFVIGATAGVLRQPGFHLETLIGTIVVGATAAVFALLSSGEKRHRDFQILNIGLWAGFALGLGVAVPRLAGDAVAASFVVGIVSAAVGAVLVEFRARRGTTGAPAYQAVDSATAPDEASTTDTVQARVTRNVVLRALNLATTG